MKTHSDSQQDAAVPPPSLGYRLVQGAMCPVLKLCGLSCRQYAELAALRLDQPLKRFESLRFRFHRMMCGICRPLPTQLENLRELTRYACVDEKSDGESSEATLELQSDAKRRIRACLKDES